MPAGWWARGSRPRSMRAGSPAATAGGGRRRGRQGRWSSWSRSASAACGAREQRRGWSRSPPKHHRHLRAEVRRCASQRSFLDALEAPGPATKKREVAADDRDVLHELHLQGARAAPPSSQNLCEISAATAVKATISSAAHRSRVPVRINSAPKNSTPAPSGASSAAKGTPCCARPAAKPERRQLQEVARQVEHCHGDARRQQHPILARLGNPVDHVGHRKCSIGQKRLCRPRHRAWGNFAAVNQRSRSSREFIDEWAKPPTRSREPASVLATKSQTRKA